MADGDWLDFQMPEANLFSVVSAAKPVIYRLSIYHWFPNLGMVNYRDDKSFVMADIPGIVKDTQRKRNWSAVLRHIGHNSILLFYDCCRFKNIVREYKILKNRLVATHQSC